MVDIKISGRKVSVLDGMRDRVTEKIGDALKVFDIQPMNCDVVLRMGRNRTKPERTTCEGNRCAIDFRPPAGFALKRQTVSGRFY